MRHKKNKYLNPEQSKAFGNKVREARARTHMRLSDLGDAISIADSTLAMWERGERPYTIEAAEAIKQILPLNEVQEFNLADAVLPKVKRVTGIARDMRTGKEQEFSVIIERDINVNFRFEVYGFDVIEFTESPIESYRITIGGE